MRHYISISCFISDADGDCYAYDWGRTSTKTEVLRYFNDTVFSEYVLYCSDLLMVAEYDSLLVCHFRAYACDGCK